MKPGVFEIGVLVPVDCSDFNVIIESRGCQEKMPLAATPFFYPRADW